MRYFSSFRGGRKKKGIYIAHICTAIYKHFSLLNQIGALSLCSVDDAILLDTYV